MTMRGARTVKQYLDLGQDRADKALLTAIKVEGFRLRKQLKKDLRAGAPGGRSLRPLSYIARRLDRQVKTGGGTTVRQSPNRKPLARLSMGVKYDARSVTGQVRVGFLNLPGQSGWKQGTWRELVERHQRGFSYSISDRMRRRIVDRGGQLGTVTGGSTPFFLRRTTRRFKTPARQIMLPFWQANQAKASRNIDRNFDLKLKGRRI